MPPRKPTCHFVSGGSEPSLENIHWHEIEKAYGQSLSEEVRRAFREATQTYLLFAQLEKERQPLSDAQKRMTTLSSSAKAFHEALRRDNPRSDAVFFVDYLIARHLDGRDNLGPIEGLMASFVRACDSANNEMKGLAESKRDQAGKEIKGPLRRRRLGAAWGQWIRKLAAIATDNDLDFKPGQNVVFGEPIPPTTPFAVLVSVLQQSLPEGYARTKHSNTKGPFIKALHIREEI